MKLILSLILIISIALCYGGGVNSINIEHNTKPSIFFNSDNINKLGNQKCFTNGNDQFQSYISGFSIVSFNGILNNQEKYVNTNSFFERGIINVDYENQRVFTNYGTMNNGLFTQANIWAFGNNNTEYFTEVVNDQLLCYSGEMSFSLPTTADIKYYGDDTIGTFPSEAFNVISDNTTQTTVLISKVDCTPSALYIEYLDKNPQFVGYAIQNFINYQAGSIDVYFDLPSVCLSNPIPISKLLDHKVKKPKILSNLF